MITREEAMEYYLRLLDREIKEHGHSFILIRSPKTGKNEWTLGEVRKAVENDCNLEDGNNPIDELLEYEKWLNERGRTMKDKYNWNIDEELG